METQPSKTFRLKPEAFRRRVRSVIWRMVLAYVLAIVIVFATSRPLSFWSVAVVISVTVVTFGFTVWFVIRRQRHAWNSWKLSVTEHEITRCLAGRRQITLALDSISKITQNKRGDMFIQGTAKSEVIFVASDVEDRPALLEMLSNFGEVDAVG